MQTEVLGHLLICSIVLSHCSLICLLRTACFFCALRCAHSFARSLARSLTHSQLVGKWMIRCLSTRLFCTTMKSCEEALHIHSMTFIARVVMVLALVNYVNLFVSRRVLAWCMSKTNAVMVASVTKTLHLTVLWARHSWRSALFCLWLSIDPWP